MRDAAAATAAAVKAFWISPADTRARGKNKREEEKRGGTERERERLNLAEDLSR